MQMHPEWRKLISNVAIALSRIWGVIACKEEINVANSTCGAKFADELWECGSGWPLQLNKVRAECTQAGAKLNKALAQEPGAVCTRAFARNKARLPDEEWQERCAAFFRRSHGGGEGGVVSESKISTEPKEYGWL